MYHFISGLPRSGSTLLSAILRQNEKFHTSISDPLNGYIESILTASENSVGIGTLVSNEKRLSIMRGVFESFYEGCAPIRFNTSRAWTSQTSLLKQLYPNFKMLVCVREIPWILDSFETLDRKNPLTVKPLYHHQRLNSVYERSEMLMGNLGQPGYVSGPLLSLKQSLFCEEVSQIMYIEYEALCRDPATVMEKVYEFLGEEYFEHDFDNVEVSYDEFDESAKIKGLHTTRRKVEYIQREPILPSDIWNKYEGESFWKNQGFDTSKLNWVKYKAPKMQYFVQSKA